MSPKSKVIDVEQYAELTKLQEERDGGWFELRIQDINDVFGGSWAMFRAWRTDVDEDEDAPVMGPENDHNSGHESSQGQRGCYKGVRIEGEFWRDEWIEHQSQSMRIRGDTDTNLPQFIVETDVSSATQLDFSSKPFFSHQPTLKFPLNQGILNGHRRKTYSKIKGD